MRTFTDGLSALALSLSLSLSLGSCGDAPAGPEGGLTLSAASHDFGEVEVGQQSKPFMLTVTNGGRRTTGALSARFNSLTGEFLIDPDQCSGEVLAPEGSCQIQLAMRSGAWGPAQVILTVSASDGDSVSTTLSGTAFIRQIFLEPDTKDFGPLTVGTEGPTQNFVLENRGTVPTGTLAVLLSGPNASDFPIAGDQCSGQQLPPQGSCTVGYRFLPQAEGTRQAYLFITGTSHEQAVGSLSGLGL